MSCWQMYLLSTRPLGDLSNRSLRREFIIFPLEVVLTTFLGDSNDAITPSESLILGPHYSKGTFIPEYATKPWSIHIYVGNTISFTREWMKRFFEIEKSLGDEYGPIEHNDVPYGKRKQATAKILSKEFSDYRDGPNR